LSQSLVCQLVTVITVQVMPSVIIPNGANELEHTIKAISSK